MNEATKSTTYLLWLLYAFAASAVASIAAENIFIWSAITLFLFFQIKNHEKINWPKGLFPLATLLFLISFFAAALWGIDPANSFLSGRVHRYLTLLLVFFLAAMPLAQDNIRKFLSLFIYGAVFCSLAGIYKHFWLHQFRVDSFSGDKMVFGGMLMVALLFNLMFLKQEPKKWIFWIFALLIAICLVFTQTRGAWLGFLTGFVILMWRMNRKWLLLGLALLITSFFFLPKSFQERVQSTWQIQVQSWGNLQKGEVTYASNERFYMWFSGLRIIRDYPMGIGQGNLSLVYSKYRMAASWEANPPHLHNNFMQILVQNGWIGLGAYLFWIFSYYWTALRYKPLNKEGRDLNWAFLCVFSATLVWGLTEYTFSHQYMNIFYALLGIQSNLWKNPEKVSATQKRIPKKRKTS